MRAIFLKNFLPPEKLIRSLYNSSFTLSVITVINRLEQFLETFSQRDLGMTLTLTFKVKVTKPHCDLSNKKKIIDLSHTIREMHAFDVYKYDADHML